MHRQEQAASEIQHLQIPGWRISHGVYRSASCLDLIQAVQRSRHSTHSATHADAMQTNLAATTAARKERLIALRRRKQAGEDGAAESCVAALPLLPHGEGR